MSKRIQDLKSPVTKLRESNGVVAGVFPVGDGPFGIAFDGGSLWVANFGSNNGMR